MATVSQCISGGASAIAYDTRYVSLTYLTVRYVSPIYACTQPSPAECVEPVFRTADGGPDSICLKCAVVRNASQ